MGPSRIGDLEQFFAGISQGGSALIAHEDHSLTGFQSFFDGINGINFKMLSQTKVVTMDGSGLERLPGNLVLFEDDEVGCSQSFQTAQGNIAWVSKSVGCHYELAARAFGM
jgi:hypothetical protein